jgi:hypothetical protein
VLTKVAGAGFLVARFSPEEVDLESVYRQASKGERSD